MGIGTAKNDAKRGFKLIPAQLGRTDQMPRQVCGRRYNVLMG